MPVVIISDINGNLIALDAVLNDVEGRQVKQIICLGDVAATGSQPCEVIARLNRIFLNRSTTHFSLLKQ